MFDLSPANLGGRVYAVEPSRAPSTLTIWTRWLRLACVCIAPILAIGCGSHHDVTQHGEQTPASAAVVISSKGNPQIVLSAKIPQPNETDISTSLCTSDFVIYDTTGILDKSSFNDQTHYVAVADAVPVYVLDKDLQSAYLEAQQKNDVKALQALIPKLPKFFYTWHVPIKSSQ